MKKNMNFEQYGVVALSEHEVGFIRGGEVELKIPGLLKKGSSFWGTAAYLASKWPEIKSGFVDGWKSVD